MKTINYNSFCQVEKTDEKNELRKGGQFDYENRNKENEKDADDANV